MEHPKHIVAVSGLFRGPEGRILLVKTPLRGWEMPGGQVELGEDLLTALERETFEEVGCQVQVEALAGVYTNPSPPEKVMFVFTGVYISGEPRAGDETTGAAWFTESEALEAVQNPANLAKLRDALGGEGRPVYRVYTTRPYGVQKEMRL